MLPSSPFTLLHVSAATVALLSGFLAMALRKGSGLHGAAGTVFFISIVNAAGAGLYLALFGTRANSGNVIGSSLTLYLAATAWVAAKRRDRKPGLFDIGALLVAVAIAITCAVWGIEAANSARGSKDGYGAVFYVVFGSIALLFGLSDVRMLLRGGVFGGKRIARHLWRMSTALLFALLSFYPGQGRLFPKWLRDTNVLYVPAVLVAGAMLFWLYRVSIRKRVPQPDQAAQPILIQGETMQPILRTLLICFLASAGVASAADNPLVIHNKRQFRSLTKMLTRAAEDMPADHYNFRPTEAVRSFGEIVGHVAESQYFMCSPVLGEKNPAPKIEKSKTSKAELVAALNDAFAYCDKAYETINDTTAVEMVKAMGSESPKLGVLSSNQLHTIEHYGNLVTYMRLKGLVPATSDPQFMKSLRR